PMGGGIQNADTSQDGFNLGATFVDFDHDGDLDLYVTRIANTPEAVRFGDQPSLLFSSTRYPNSMWRNNGDGTFTDVAESIGLTGEEPTFSSIGTDYNNDRAIDLVTTGKLKPTIFENPREGKFPPRQPWPKGDLGATLGVAVL